MVGGVGDVCAKVWGSGVGCGWDVVGWDDVWVVRNVGGVQLQGFVNGGVPRRDIVAEARVTVGFVDDVVGEGGLTNRFVGGGVYGALGDDAS